MFVGGITSENFHWEPGRLSWHSWRLARQRTVGILGSTTELKDKKHGLNISRTRTYIPVFETLIRSDHCSSKTNKKETCFGRFGHVACRVPNTNFHGSSRAVLELGCDKILPKTLRLCTSSICIMWQRCAK